MHYWNDKNKSLPRVRLELTAFRLWDWRAAYCATEAWLFIIYCCRKKKTNHEVIFYWETILWITLVFLNLVGFFTSFFLFLPSLFLVFISLFILKFTAKKGFIYKKLNPPIVDRFKKIRCPGWGSNSRPSDYSREWIMRLTRCLLRYRGLVTYSLLLYK